MALGNGSDEILLFSPAGELIDVVEYDDGSFPDLPNTSLQLGGNLDLNAVDNSVGALWCPATQRIGEPDSDLGTPGGPNGVCEVTEFTIQELRNPDEPGHPAVNTQVAVRGAVVVGIDSFGRHIFVQDPAGGPWSGIYLSNPSIRATGITVGMVLEVEGLYLELDLGDVGSGTLSTIAATQLVVSGTDAVPAATVLAPGGFSDSETAEQWESTLVEVIEVTVSELLDSGEFEVSDGETAVSVDDLLFPYPEPLVDDEFSIIAGPLNYSFGDYKIVPRSDEDMISTTVRCPNGVFDGDYNVDGEDLEGYTAVTGDLTLRNTDLRDLDELVCLQTVGGTLSLWENAALTHVDGLSRLTSIGGWLYVDGNTRLLSLDGFSNLRSVEGSMNIRNNRDLANVDGLWGITSVDGGFLVVHNNSSLTHVDGLVGITSVDGDVIIENNANLENVDGLAGLRSAGAYVAIRRNAELTSVSGLTGITSIEGELSIHNNGSLCDTDVDALLAYLDFAMDTDPTLGDTTNNTGPCEDCAGTVYDGDVDDDNLAEMEGVSFVTGEVSVRADDLAPLRCLQHVGGKLSLFRNASTDLDDLSNLATIGSAFNLRQAWYLTNLDGLSNLISVGGYFWLDDNSRLSHVDGLSGLLRVGAISVRYNAGLQNIDGLSRLRRDAVIEIQDNSQLLNVDGLARLRHASNISIDENNSLEDLDGLAGLARVDVNIGIEDNPALERVDGFNNLTEANGVFIRGNANLESVDGFNSLSSVNYLEFRRNPSQLGVDGFSALPSSIYYLALEDNDALTGVAGLSEISEIRSSLFIAQNQSLVDFDDLQNLNSVGRSVYVIGNDALANLDALSNLTSIEQRLVVADNKALQSVDGLSNLTLVGAITHLTDLEVHSNAALCQESVNALVHTLNARADLELGDISNNGGYCVLGVPCEDLVPTIDGATEGNDVLTGTDGDDIIVGGGGDDIIDGLGGDDILCGGQGNDTIEGGSGNDALFGGSGSDSLNGGLDLDAAVYISSPNGVNIDLKNGLATGGDSAGDTLNNIEILVGSPFADLLMGDGQANTVIGGEGDDTLAGREARDLVDGGGGTDSCTGEIQVACEL